MSRVLDYQPPAASTATDTRLPDPGTNGQYLKTVGGVWVPATLALVNADVDASAAIAKSKLANLAIVNADVDAGAAIAESKLSLASDAAAGTASRRSLGTGATQAASGTDSRLSDTRTPTDGSVTNAKVNASAAIAYSKLALTAGIVNADIAAAAAIVMSKLALPIPPDVRAANEQIVSVAASSNAVLAAALTPYLYPLDPMGAPFYALDRLGTRVNTGEASSLIGLAIYSATIPSSNAISATLECQLNATISGASNGHVHGQVTSGAAGSGATVPFTLDFTTKRYWVGIMVSSISSLALTSNSFSNINTDFGILRWTSAARSAVTDWPGSFTEANVASPNTQRHALVTLLTATGANLL